MNPYVPPYDGIQTLEFESSFGQDLVDAFRDADFRLGDDFDDLGWQVLPVYARSAVKENVLLG